MAQKFYVVWAGHTPGIYTDWATCKRQVDGFSNSKYKSFPTLSQAETAYGGKPKASKVGGAPRQAKEKANSHAGMPVKDGVMIFCDGACKGNPGPAGSGLAIYRDNVLTEAWYGQFQAKGTNNTAELHALQHAFLIAQDELAKGNAVSIYADSSYAIKSMVAWGAKWKRDHWLDEGQPRKNVEILKPMYDLYLELKGRVSIEHVKGHAGIEGNEVADRMSVLAVQEQEAELRRYSDPLDVTEILNISA